MDKTTKKLLGGHSFKSMVDTRHKNMPRTAVDALCKRVETGDPEAVKEFLDRYYGKPAQALAIDHTTNGNDLQIATAIDLTILSGEKIELLREVIRETLRKKREGNDDSNSES